MLGDYPDQAAPPHTGHRTWLTLRLRPPRLKVEYLPLQAPGLCCDPGLYAYLNPLGNACCHEWLLIGGLMSDQAAHKEVYTTSSLFSQEGKSKPLEAVQYPGCDIHPGWQIFLCKVTNLCFQSLQGPSSSHLADFLSTRLPPLGASREPVQGCSSSPGTAGCFYF